MRLSAAEHAFRTFDKYGIQLEHVRCIDVGGTRQVWLETNQVAPILPRQKVRDVVLRLLGEQPPPPKKIVVVTDNPLLKAIPNLQFLDAGFNEQQLQTTSDIQADFLVDSSVDPLKDSFDLVVCFDTLEHVSDPFRFCNNLVCVTKPGGYIYLQTVFTWEYHPSPKDYYRFSPDGLQECFSRTDAQILECNWHLDQISTYILAKKTS